VNLREQILNAPDLPEEFLEVPEWECTIIIRALNGTERANLLQNNTLPNGRPDLVRMYPALAILSVRDPETKELVFQPADRDGLNAKSGAALERIAQVAIRMNQLVPDAVDAAVKNS